MKRTVLPIFLALVVTTQASKAQTGSEIVELVPARTSEAIGAEFSALNNAKAAAEARRAYVESRMKTLVSRIETHEAEMEVIEKRIELAEAQGNEAEVNSAQKEMESARQVRLLLETQESLFESEAELAGAEISYLDAALEAIGREETLANKRAEHAQNAAREGAEQKLAELEMEIYVTEGELLKALRERADSRAEFAQREAEVVGRQVELHEVHGIMSGLHK